MHYAEASANFSYQATNTRPDSISQIYVLVIGETARADNFGVLGYSNTELGGLLALGSVLGFLLGTGLSSFVDTSPRFNAADVLWPVLLFMAALFLLLLYFPVR